MRQIPFVLALSAYAVVPTIAQASDVELAAIMRTNKLSSIEAAAVVVIADVLGVDADFVIRTGRSTGQPPSVYGPAMIYARECNRPFKDVWRDRGRGWGNVAHDIGMHPGTFNQYRKKGYSVDEIIWMNSMNREYRISPNQYQTWRGQGFSRNSIIECSARYDGNSRRMTADFDKRRSNDRGKIQSKGRSDDRGSKGKGSDRGKGKGKSKGKGGRGDD